MNLVSVRAFPDKTRPFETDSFGALLRESGFNVPRS